ncbi:hypothetical protein WMY93_008891 [Mugilogobius chulae]|uniref:Transposase n=1 Tax=Mugilogobius chulae TaxID=88201 RepID=A0AAW0PNJ3_9GOBI
MQQATRLTRICQNAVHLGRPKQLSVRHGSIFSHSKVSLRKWMNFMYRFCQGLRLRQIDLMDDSIAASSATLSRMAKRVREVCRTAVKRLRRQTGQMIGGRTEFVAIDESHFRHKRKRGEWLEDGRGRNGSLECWVFEITEEAANSTSRRAQITKAFGPHHCSPCERRFLGFK